MKGLRRSRHLFYTAAVVEGTERLLLGPFSEKAVAETSLPAARELGYLIFGVHLSPTVKSVRTARVAVPAAGELNVMAMALAQPIMIAG